MSDKAEEHRARTSKAYRVALAEAAYDRSVEEMRAAGDLIWPSAPDDPATFAAYKRKVAAHVAVFDRLTRAKRATGI